MKLRTRIVVGFAVVIAPFLVSIVSNVILQVQTGRDLAVLGDLIVDERLAVQLQTAVLTQDRIFTDFVTNHGARLDPDYVSESIAEMDRLGEREEQLLDELEGAISDPERIEGVREMITLVDRFQEVKPELLAAVARRDDIVFNTMDVVGPRIDALLTEILVSAEADGDLVAAYEAALALRHLLRGRLAVNKFLVNNRQSDLEESTTEFAELVRQLDALDRDLQNPRRRAILAQVRSGSDQYFDALDDVGEAIITRNRLDDEVIFPALSRIDALSEDLALGISDDLEELRGVIAMRASRARLFSQIAGATALLIGLAAAFVLTRSILTQLGADPAALRTLARRIAEGDLTTTDLGVDHGDNLAGSMQQMSDNQRANVVAIKEVTTAAGNSINSLASTAEQTSVSGRNMAKNTAAVRKDVDGINERVREALHEIEEITVAVQELDDHVQDQTAMTEESTASVEQIVSSLTNVASIVSARRGDTEALMNAARKGDEGAAETRTMIEEVASFAGQITEITEVITGITSQTNLLSMNAAIEAAHAGDAGKGFAVVADEIRKLAEDSAGNSTRIQEILSEITARIESATQLARAGSETFEQVAHNAEENYRAYSELEQTAKEMSIGGNEVLTAIAELTAAASKVRDSEEHMKHSIRVVVDNLKAIADQLASAADRMAEIDAGNSEVSTAIDEVQRLTQSLSHQVDRLGTSVERFRV